MKNTIVVFFLLFLACKPLDKTQSDFKNDFTLAFGSCNNQELPNNLWSQIIKNEPTVWVWGGDNIYADTENMKLMQSYYEQVKNNTDYQKLLLNTEIMGTWDDHDYGLNDGGLEFTKKDSAQQLLLDFLDVDTTDPRRTREGIYTSQSFTIGSKSIQLIILDTRYFRTALTSDPSGTKRYLPNDHSNGTILGEAQWAWLDTTLKNSKADFNILMSSIQVLSFEHGFETWGNMPNEVEKLKKLILDSGAKNVIILSGDRHISEISETQIKNLPYPLIDFTSSGLTHTYKSFTSEPNQFRISKVVKEKNFGLLKFNLKTETVHLELRGIHNEVLLKHSQKY